MSSRSITRGSTSGTSLFRFVSSAASVMIGLMTICFAMGAPIWLTYFISFSGLVLTVMFLGANTTYTLQPEGLEVRHDSLLGSLGKRARIRIYPWSDLKSYRFDEKLLRDGSVLRYLEIFFNGATFNIPEFTKVHSNREEYERFCSSFTEVVDAINSTPSAQQVPRISRKPSFYVTVAGRALTILYILMVAAACWFFTIFEVFYSNLFFVSLMVFGGSYLIYRSFFQKQA